MLHTSTASGELVLILKILMRITSLDSFRLVGGTGLSLLRGHRVSEDIDLFAALEYGSINFESIEHDIKQVINTLVNDDKIFGLKHIANNTLGLHLHLGVGEHASVKVDILNWTDGEFIFPIQKIEGIRFATIEEIALMKLATISRGGRKKDFWDMSEIFETHNLKSLLELYQTKYPYFETQEVIDGMTNFTLADMSPDPICLKQKHWDLVKTEMLAAVTSL